MRKPAFRICENKGVYRLLSNCAADRRLCFRYIDSNPLLAKSEISILDLVGNPEDRFSHDVADIITQAWLSKKICMCRA